MEIAMAKKKVAPKEPVVSQIPLPISDTPLVIDLPDGQKLVIGKLAQGSVIEVATWRGTGRPDSRTNRLMLGMSSGNVNTANKEQNGTVSNSSIPNKYIATGLNLLNQIKKYLLSINLKGLFARVKTLKPKPGAAKISEGRYEPIELTTNVEIDEWLAKITRSVEEKSAKKKTARKK
jgi:hypothetical protein